MKRTSLTCVASAVAAVLLSGAVQADDAGASKTVAKIGLLIEMAGPYAAIGGIRAVEAVKMAAEDFMKDNPGAKVEIVTADHQDKVDVAAGIAREWFDNGKADMVLDLSTSGIALAVMEIAKQKDKIAIVTSPASSDITNAKCTSTSIHYLYDTYALAGAVARPVVEQGGKKWFFITADYAFGTALERDTTAFIKAADGQVVGSLRVPLNTADFSSYILQAQASGADVVALANAGADFVTAVKTATEFGLDRPGGQQLAGLLVFISDIDSIGLKTAQGLTFATSFYWDFDDETRAWSKRFFERMHTMPTQVAAGDYSATLHYLQAVKAAGTTETSAVMQKMRDLPINDFYAKNGKIREDGRVVHDMYRVQVKTPAESKYPWDYYSVQAVIPGDQAFKPLAQSTCPLVAKP